MKMGQQAVPAGHAVCTPAGQTLLSPELSAAAAAAAAASSAHTRRVVIL